ncbi:WD40/YVTN/BNR-like repeat-containing protein [Coraliomargarita parva]|uniref:WD40/YVTN/BNR-like repeat-containing protein n=1 Tax=Coraliomargarita parva TaxID=3014050 RepID=UPI0022B311FE|nr:hypothetical protein [Coraliomargarita parva]
MRRILLIPFLSFSTIWILSACHQRKPSTNAPESSEAPAKEAVTGEPVQAKPPTGEPIQPMPDAVVESVFNPKENLAHYGHWRSSKIGGGGYLLNILTNEVNPDILYTHSDVGGIFRSDDEGRNWRMVHINYHPQSLDCVRDLLVNPQNPDELIAAVGDQWTPQQGLFKSTDGGESWKKVLDTQVFGNGSNRSTGRILQRSPKAPETLYAAPGWDGAFVSHDNGESWESLGLEQCYVNDLDIDRHNPNRLFVCAESRKMSNKTTWNGSRNYRDLAGGFYRSEDGGRTWARLSEIAPIEIVQDPVNAERWYGLFDSRTVAYTEDHGDSWQEANEGLEISESKPSPTSDKSYKAIGAGPDFLLLANGKGSFFIKQPTDSPWRKIESGERFQGEWYGRSKPNTWDKFGRATACIVVDPLNPKHWFFGDYYTIYQTWNSGKNWTLTIDGIENTVIHAVHQMPNNPNIVHMGMADNGYFRSTDGAASFQKGGGSADNYKAIAVAPSNPDVVYILGPKYHGWYADTLFVSQDGGVHFERSPMKNIPQAKDQWRVNSLAVDVKNPDKVYIGVSGPIAPGQGGVWMSSDGGQSWTWDSEGLPEGNSFFQSSIWDNGYQLARNPNGSMVAMKHHMLYYRSSDRQPWQKSSIQLRNSQSKFTQLLTSPDESGVYYLSEQYGGLHRSEDNGRSWSKILDQGVHAFTIDQSNSRFIAVALDDAGGILITGNAGYNWHPVDDHLPQRHRLKMAFAGRRLVVGTPGNGVFYLPLESIQAKE